MFDTYARSDEAVRILGPKKVLLHPSDAELLIYTCLELQDCAKANWLGHSDWRLAWCEGRTLASQLKRWEISPTSQPCCHAPSAKFLDEDTYPWMFQEGTPGYYLIDFAGRYRGLEWGDQEDELVAEFGTKLFARAPEQCVMEAAFAFFMRNGGERLLEYDYHWGAIEDASESRCAVGVFDDKGWSITMIEPYVEGEDHVVCLWRKPELGLISKPGA